MKDKNIATVRFRTEGVEAELYRKLLSGKEKAGLSMPDYIKKILADYFADEDSRDRQSEQMALFQEEMLVCVEQTIRMCISGNAATTAETPVMKNGTENGESGEKLPPQGTEIPAGALEFLAGMEV